MPWVRVVFGWPFVALAGVAFSIAFLTRHSWFGFVGAALAMPFCFLVSLYPLPIWHWGGPLALTANCVSAWLLHRGRRDIAFSFLLPFMIVSTLLGLLVLRQTLPHSPLSP